jgi:hypothetical protein
VTEENSEARAGEVGREGGGAEAGGKITPSRGRRRYFAAMGRSGVIWNRDTPNSGLLKISISNRAIVILVL